MKQQLFRYGKKGFTLIEIIVVLLILAILAAILIPSMTGYINEAQKAELYETARLTLLAVQSVAVEEYAKGMTVNSKGFNNFAYNSDSRAYYTPKIRAFFDFIDSGYTYGNFDVYKNGRVICIHLWNTRNGGQTYNEIQYLNCMLDGVVYDGKYIINVWQGKPITPFIDPAHASVVQ